MDSLISRNTYSHRDSVAEAFHRPRRSCFGNENWNAMREVPNMNEVFHHGDCLKPLPTDHGKRLRLFLETAGMVLDHARKVSQNVRQRVKRVLDKHDLGTEAPSHSEFM
jgi:hypothetical protein